MLEPGLVARGYERASGPTVAAALFWKLKTPLVLTLGIEFSRLHDERFTGSFYLAPWFCWGFMPIDYPDAAYKRVGRFLTSDERARLLRAPYADPGVVDAWWIGFSEESAEAFVESVGLAEGRIPLHD